MKKIIARNLNISKETLRKIKIHIDTLKKDSCDVKNCAWHNGTLTIEQIEQGDILFKSHLSIIDSPEGTARVLDYFKNAAYIDSISGGDFTGILTRSFFLQDELNRLKVIESALTEFAIIDARIYKNYGKGGAAVVRDIEENKGPEPTVDEVYAEIKKLLENNTEKGEIRKHILQTFELDLIARRLVADNETEIKQEITSTIQQKHDRNKQETENTISNNAEINKNKVFHQMLKQRRLYIYDIDKNGDIIDLDGKTVVNILHAGDNKAICSPMFVSIHLSIIEKIIKETGLLALDVMAGLKKVFGGTKFITIHSGRGNLSADLEKDLKDYAFLSLSAVQAAMDDSKYFLSQLLYNNCYIGKGRINHK